ncbi:hypothetical protein B0H13DRAFT_1892153 [Mycena leptocephala]|nr:hypothetical protein B0H13DRAFT_1892153 [Mycena leptocephala]
MAAESLPDEILSKILSPALNESGDVLRYQGEITVRVPLGIQLGRARMQSIVTRRYPLTARALQAALGGNSDIDKFIKMLRLEDGFGASIQHILQKTPNLADIFLSLQVRASDSTDSTNGLALGLPSINPTRMIIYDHPIEPSETSMSWVSLMRSRRILGGEREAFVRSLGACPTLKSISFPAPGQMDVLLFLDLAENPRSKGSNLVRGGKYWPSPYHSTPDSLPLQQAAVSKYKPTISSPTNPSFQPLVSCPERVRERIWSRILFFAMLPLETLERDRDEHYRRLPYLLVSHLFHVRAFLPQRPSQVTDSKRLALPYLYRYVTFPRERSLHRFSHHVAAAPADAPPRTPRRQLSRVFPCTPHLTRLLGDSETRMPWAAVTALADAAGGTLEELSGFQFHETAGLKSESPAAFAKFTALRSLSWDGGYRPGLTASFLERKAPVPKDGLPALQFLHARSPEAFDILAQMELPKLRRVQFEMKFKGWGIPLLQKHSHKLTELEVEDVNIDREHSVLQVCPNVTILASRIAYDTKDNLGCPTEGFQHTALAMLILAKDVRSAKVKDEQEWATFFNRLEFACFPALREIRDLKEWVGEVGGWDAAARCPVWIGNSDLWITLPHSVPDILANNSLRGWGPKNADAVKPLRGTNLRWGRKNKEEEEFARLCPPSSMWLGLRVRDTSALALGRPWANTGGRVKVVDSVHGSGQHVPPVKNVETDVSSNSGVRVNNIAGGAFVPREREESDRRNVATKQSQQTPYTVSGAFFRRINNALYMPRPGGGLLVDCVVEELRWPRSNRIHQGTNGRSS